MWLFRYCLSLHIKADTNGLYFPDIQATVSNAFPLMKNMNYDQDFT